ncbi:hypothetical protein [Leisingera sp. ANG59]|uniref:hypothetical protein n=1 Tax=Leisingera sp. ANG59 TaxID=2675221 RepID=UPI001572FD55|nr:hypothetical protein [Leisingera sp. ANG59]NSY39518.1 hypothetical protein [Leisingera sp. ANG59]
MNTLSLGAPFQGPPAPADGPAAAAQARPDPDAKPDPKAKSKPAPGPQPRGARNQAVQPPRLSTAVLAQIANALRQGGPDTPPLAAQADLVALHKRIAEMFTTLNEGLGARAEQKAAADRATLSARIDQLEEAVNRMEGALRIEFEPVLKAAVAEALTQSAPKPRRRWRGALAAALLAGAALAAGAWWHEPLQQAAETAAQILAGWLGSAA